MGHVKGFLLSACLFSFTTIYAQQNNDMYSSFEVQLEPTGQQNGSYSNYTESTVVISTIVVWSANQQIYDDIVISSGGQLTIQGSTEMMGTTDVTVQSGGKLVIDSGNLSNVNLILNSGSSLEITNGGVLESRSGFSAPVGATVVITNGKIS